jgi:hypothetical protein
MRFRILALALVGLTIWQAGCKSHDRRKACCDAATPTYRPPTAAVAP